VQSFLGICIAYLYRLFVSLIRIAYLYRLFVSLICIAYLYGVAVKKASVKVIGRGIIRTVKALPK
jgi:hypothetical protein